MANRFIDRRLLAMARPAGARLIGSVAAGFLAGIFTVLQARALSLAVNAVFLQSAALADIDR